MKKSIFLCIIIAASSCTSHYYMPTAQNVPLFTEEKQLQVSYGMDEYMTNSQIAYSVTNHIAFQANSAYEDPGKFTKSAYVFYELGLGYFNNFDNKLFVTTGTKSPKRKVHLVYEVFTGYGFGTLNRGNDEGNPSADISRVYFQPAFGLKTTWFEIAFSSRFSRVNYDLHGNGIYNINEMELNVFDGSETHYFFEPCLTIKMGFKHVKIHYQILKAKQLTNYFVYNPITENQAISIVATLPLHTLF